MKQLLKAVDELSNPGAVVVVDFSRLPEQQVVKAIGFVEGAAHVISAVVEPVTRTRYALRNVSG